MGKTKLELADEVRKLREKGMSIRAIARQLHIGDRKAADLIHAINTKAKPAEPAMTTDAARAIKKIEDHRRALNEKKDAECLERAKDNANSSYVKAVAESATIKAVAGLHERGESIRAIARKLHIGDRKVKKILEELPPKLQPAAEPKEAKSRKPTASSVRDALDRVCKDLQRYQEIFWAIRTLISTRPESPNVAMTDASVVLDIICRAEETIRTVLGYGEIAGQRALSSVIAKQCAR